MVYILLQDNDLNVTSREGMMPSISMGSDLIVEVRRFYSVFACSNPNSIFFGQNVCLLTSQTLLLSVSLSDCYGQLWLVYRRDISSPMHFAVVKILRQGHTLYNQTWSYLDMRQLHEELNASIDLLIKVYIWYS